MVIVSASHDRELLTIVTRAKEVKRNPKKMIRRCYPLALCVEGRKFFPETRSVMVAKTVMTKFGAERTNP